MTFRVPRWAVAGLDGDREDLHWAVLQPMWHELQTPYEPDPRLDQATLGQRALYALHWLGSEASNGGLHQYFWNPTGMLADEAVQGAHRLRLSGYADLLAEAIATVFDRATVPQDQRARQRALDGLSDQRRLGAARATSGCRCCWSSNRLTLPSTGTYATIPGSSSWTSRRRTRLRGRRRG
jgi:hypothetical protein